MSKNIINTKRSIPIAISMAISAGILYWGINYITSHDIETEVTLKERQKKVIKSQKASQVDLDLNAKSNIANLPQKAGAGYESNNSQSSLANISNQADRVTVYQKTIEKFQENTNKIKVAMENQDSELKKYIANVPQIQQDIDQDISCLEQYPGKCALKSEKYLLEKGFPNDFGNPKYIHSIIEELKKYKVDIVANLEASKKDFDKTVSEYNLRLSSQNELNTKFEQFKTDTKNTQLAGEIEKILNSN